MAQTTELTRLQSEARTSEAEVDQLRVENRELGQKLAELQVEVEERLQACPKPLKLSWMARPAPEEEPLLRGRPELRLQDA